MTKRLSKIVVFMLAASLFLTACGKSKDNEEEPKKDISVEAETEKDKENLEDIEKPKEDSKDEASKDDSSKANENNKKVSTYARALDLVDEIISNFEGVRLEDERIQLTDDDKSIYTADIYLFLDEANEEEAKKLIDKYSEDFKKEFTEKEKYEELILYWLTPNHDKAGAIEKIYY